MDFQPDYKNNKSSSVDNSENKIKTELYDPLKKEILGQFVSNKEVSSKRKFSFMGLFKSKREVFVYKPARKVDSPKMYKFLCSLFGDDLKPSEEVLKLVVANQRISWYRRQPLSLEKVKVILGLDGEQTKTLDNLVLGHKYLKKRVVFALLLTIFAPFAYLFINYLILGFDESYLTYISLMLFMMFVVCSVLYESLVSFFVYFKNFLYERYSPGELDFKDGWGNVLNDSLPGQENAKTENID